MQKMFRRTLVCAGIAGVLFFVTPTVRADETRAPARMTSCTVIPDTIERRGTPPPETIRVSFMITGDVPADLVRFTAVGRAGGFRQFTARGYFTKSVMILNRELEADRSVEAATLPHGVECALTFIHYVDGSSWSATADSAARR
jgi:acyl dehydratase